MPDTVGGSPDTWTVVTWWSLADRWTAVGSPGDGASGAMLDGMIWTLLLYWSSASGIFDAETTGALVATGLEDTWMMVMLVEPLVSPLALVGGSTDGAA